MVREGHLFTIPDHKRRWLYPSLQFNASGEVEPWINALLNVIPTRNPWMILNYLVNPDDCLDGRTPIDLLKAGQVELVLTAAKNLAQQGG